MRIPPLRGGRSAFPGSAALLGVLAWSLASAPAAAQGRSGRRAGEARTHVVESGETLTQIAGQYGVTAEELQQANELDDPDRIRAGQTLSIPAAAAEPAPRRAASERAATEPARREAAAAEAADDDPRAPRVTRAGVVLYVAAGQTLSDIATSYGTTLSRLKAANDLEDADALRVGQRILVPGAREVATVRRARREEPLSNPITFLRVGTDEERTVRLFDGRGRVRSSARDDVDFLMRHTGSGSQRRIHVDLLRMLQRVADHWPGKRILIYSGYRPFRRSQFTARSKHNVGRAIDFRVEGVGNGELRDYCRTFSRAGVGYYPNSSFVHLDTRDDRGYWVDYSGPGEAPRYGRERREAEGDDDADEATADRAATRSRRSRATPADGDEATNEAAEQATPPAAPPETDQTTANAP
jgi:uncharacterized protein YcbK (DUF882 family)